MKNTWSMQLGRWALCAISFLVIAISVASPAAMMDVETRNLLIDKFQKVLIGLAPADPSYTSVSLRLADLLSERARFDAMKELEHGCIECNAGVKDRKEALKLYEGSLVQVPLESQGKIVLQIGHLYELIGEHQKSETVYLGIIKENKNPQLVAEARAALGEYYFKARKFSQAREQFEAARGGPLGQLGLASYRIAWCLFNEGRIADAALELKKILESPQLLTRNGTAGVVSIDKQFQEEIARDYATFLGRLGGSRTEAEELYRLSPETSRLDHVEFLATELERLGAKDKSIAVWQFSQERQTQPKNRLQGHVRLAQLYMDLNKQSEAVKEFEKALTLWNQVACDESCVELKSRIRKLVIDWNRINKKGPSVELLQAYETYLGVFSDDSEMIYWAAQVARDVKNYEKSLSLYQTYVTQSSAKLANLKVVKSAATSKSKTASDEVKEQQDLTKNIENALLSQIEVAELSKDTVVRTTVYDRYLQFSITQEKKTEVMYQKAHLTYEQEKYKDAAEQLKTVALLQTKQSQELREQAADLALDALALLKDDELIESWAKAFAVQFPKKKAEYLSVARKSVLNQSAQAVSGNADLNVAWNVLSRADLADADNADKTLYYKNKIILAEKLGKYADGRNAVDTFLKIPGLKLEDIEFGLAKKAWFAELALDFVTAYDLNQKMKLADMKSDEKTLRLAMFAELANDNPQKYYEQYLLITSNKENARLVVARLIRESKTPISLLSKFENLLKDDQPLWAQLSWETYAKTRDAKFLAGVLRNKNLMSTVAGKEFLREDLLKQIVPLAAETANHVIGSKTQAEIARGIKKRANLIEKLESLAGKAVESTDWMAQVVSLSLLGREIERFYSEIISLPVPAGLTPEEESQYLQLLSQQAGPYQVKAADIKAKLKEFWTSGQLAKIISDFQGLDGDVKGIYASQISILQTVAADQDKTTITAALDMKTKSKSQPSLVEIEKAQQLVRESPMDTANLLNLSRLQKQLGRTTLAAYLEARAQKASQKSLPETQKETAGVVR